MEGVGAPLPRAKKPFWDDNVRLQQPTEGSSWTATHLSLPKGSHCHLWQRQTRILQCRNKKQGSETAVSGRALDTPQALRTSLLMLTRACLSRLQASPEAIAAEGSQFLLPRGEPRDHITGLSNPRIRTRAVIVI